MALPCQLRMYRVPELFLHLEYQRNLSLLAVTLVRNFVVRIVGFSADACSSRGGHKESSSHISVYIIYIHIYTHIYTYIHMHNYKSYIKSY
jgi:hypothetical protein